MEYLWGFSLPLLLWYNNEVMGRKLTSNFRSRLTSDNEGLTVNFRGPIWGADEGPAVSVSASFLRLADNTGFLLIADGSGRLQLAGS